MRLLRVYIENYKSLKNFEINFNDLDTNFNSLAFRFLIGKNGAGKSVFLEALSLIFTRIIQDESPGFYFELEYFIRKGLENTVVKIKPRRERHESVFRLIISIGSDENNFTILKNPFSKHEELHPRRIIAQASGPTNQLEDVLLISPSHAIASDIYDVINDSNYIESSVLTTEVDDLTHKLRKLKESQKYIFIDGESASLVLIALCAAIPNSDEPEYYCKLRSRLFSQLPGFRPIAFSLKVDENKLEYLKNSKYLSSSLRLFIHLASSKNELLGSGRESINDGVFQSPIFTNTLNEVLENTNLRTVIFNIEKNALLKGFSYHVSKLDLEKDPIDILNALLAAKRENLLIDAHLFFKMNKNDTLLTEASLSDGEYLWIARLGLALITRYEDNSLLLFDEPDIHLNESWNVSFVSYLYEFLNKNDVSSHECLIATHSTLVLTDADQDQLYHFKIRGGTPFIDLDDMATFAGSREEISVRIFGNEDSIGNYSKRKIKQFLKIKDVNKLDSIFGKVGPGFYKYQLRDYIYGLKEKKDK